MRILADGSNDVSRDEFEQFFAQLSASSMNKLRGVRSRVARPTGAASARADADARAAAGASVRRRIDTDPGNLADLPDQRGSPPIHRAAGANGGARASPPITRLLCRSYGQTWRELREARSLAAARRSDVVAGVTPGPLAGRRRRSPSPPLRAAAPARPPACCTRAARAPVHPPPHAYSTLTRLVAEYTRV